MKKFVSTLLVFALMLVLSTSAFAAKGIGDTPESAITLIPNNTVKLYIEDSTDNDWFTWTNNTGKMQKFHAAIEPDKYWGEFRFACEIRFIDGSSTGLTYANYLHYFNNVYIPDGAKVYFLVQKENNTMTTMTQYSLKFDVYDI